MASDEFDAVVVGAGHAGCEAALALSRMGLGTLLLTLSMDAVALMPCNPAIGGTGKGHLVREVDALGGQMGLCADQTTLQSRMLNRGKGPAVYSLRAQADKRRYHETMLRTLFETPNLAVRQGEAVSFRAEHGRLTGVTTATGETIACRAAVLCAGVYLNSRVLIGDWSRESGPQGLQSAALLTATLAGLGLETRRFKTGTPARVDVRSIDFDEMTPQAGDEPPTPFSFLTDTPPVNRALCYLTYTTPETHRVIRENLCLSPMYAGRIHGTGARYCPSIEDKVVRFADKDRHPLFLEPEGADSPEWYVQGMSSSLPERVQWEMYRTVPGMRRARLTRLAYAIEYDCVDPTGLTAALMARETAGLFLAGQVNGTSGYEEAAAQGLYAGINAALYLRGDAPFLLTRDMAYIGVMVDDLTCKGTDEPYRMMTSRAEHRLLLRQDNADLRLTALSHALGLASDERMRRAERRRSGIAELRARAEKTSVPPSDARAALLAECGQPPLPTAAPLTALMRRPALPPERLFALCPPLLAWGEDVRAEVALDLRYEGYLQKERAQIARARAMEDWLLPDDLDYLSLETLRVEARQKLQKRRPRSLSQASRIPGVSPADIAVLMVFLKRRRDAGARQARPEEGE